MTNKPSPNKYGRRWGRGVRPYLIVVKLIAVAAFLGGLMSVLAGSLTAPSPTNAAGWELRAEQLERVFTWVIIPGSTVACVMGFFLLVSVWRPLLRMRWLVLKAVLAIGCLPMLHLFLRSRLIRLEETLEATGADLAIAHTIGDQMTVGVAAAIGLGLIVAVLGRVKPRLGQDYGKTFATPPDR